MPLRLWLYLMPRVGELLYTTLRHSQDLASATLRLYYHDLSALPEAELVPARACLGAGLEQWPAPSLSVDTALGRHRGSLRMAAWRERLEQLAIPTLLI